MYARKSISKKIFSFQFTSKEMIFEIRYFYVVAHFSFTMNSSTAIFAFIALNLQRSRKKPQHSFC